MSTFDDKQPQSVSRSDQCLESGAENTDSTSSELPKPGKLGWLWTPIDIGPLIFFRILFGGIMAYHVYWLWTGGWMELYYMSPVFHFTFPGFGWVQTWPVKWIPIQFLVMGFAAVGITLGLYYRFSAILFFFTFTHMFLMEKSLYQNHYYLICLISFVMIFLPCHRAFSIDVLRRPQLRAQVAPAWTLDILKIQIAIVYFYGGLAKLDSDWLQGMPLRLWLGRNTDVPMIGQYLTEDWVVYFFAHSGLLYDLLVAPLLLWRRTRLIMYLATLAFHLTNSVLWDIGLFPWFMIGATLLFFDPGWVRKVLRLPPVPEVMLKQPTRTLVPRQRATAALLGVYLIWQLLFPLRHFLYPGHPSWTEEGHQFAWHMMLREKDIAIRFYVRNTATGKRGIMELSSFLNYRQLSHMGRDADMILQFTHFARDHYRQHGKDQLEIYVLNMVSLNGRKPQLMLDPQLDYAKTERRLFSSQPWILPLEEPLRTEGWNVPVEKWEEVLELDLPEDIYWHKPPSRSEVDLPLEQE